MESGSAKKCRFSEVPHHAELPLQENEPARRMLEKKRPNLPVYEFLSGLTTLAMAPGRKGRRHQPRRAPPSAGTGCILYVFKE